MPPNTEKAALATRPIPKIVQPDGLDKPESTIASDLFQLPLPFVTVEANPFHGWRLAVRRGDRTRFGRYAVALLSVAEDEAAALADERGWGLA